MSIPPLRPGRTILPMRFVAAALFVSGCQLPNPKLVDYSGSEKEHLPHSSINRDLAEATFRYQFAQNESGQQSSVSTYCIGYGADPSKNGSPFDPPNSFLKRLSDIKPPVQPESSCSWIGGAVFNETKKPALIFEIESVKCVHDANCEVNGGYYEASLSASGNTYLLERRAGKWIVVKSKERWIALIGQRSKRSRSSNPGTESAKWS